MDSTTTNSTNSLITCKKTTTTSKRFYIKLYGYFYSYFSVKWEKATNNKNNKPGLSKCRLKSESA